LDNKIRPVLWTILSVLGFGLLPCTSGPVLIGYFYGWYWSALGIVVLWGGSTLYLNKIYVIDRRAAEKKEIDRDVS
jgi:hypothetical protein